MSLILIDDNLRQVSLVIESAKSERDAVLGSEEKMNTLDPAIAQINRRVQKLPAKRALYFL